MGLPGSGKTYLTERLVPLISAIKIRKQLREEGKL
tara:strand:- start:154 stop:258 length:105 start_codon:yes stop_codon:yes gene_type:complete